MSSGVENSVVGKAIASLIRDPEYLGLIERLYKCWKEIGYPAETQRTLETGVLDAILRPLRENVNACVTGEENQLQQYRDTVKNCLARVSTISTELSLPPYQMDSSLALIEQAHVLTEKADALCARRQERMDLLRDLIEKNEVLCRVLEKPIYVIDPDKVPSHDALTAFSTSNAKLQQERDERLRRLQELKTDVSALMTQLERQPTSDLEIQLLLEPETLFHLTNAKEHQVKELKNSLIIAKEVLAEEIMQLRAKSQTIRDRLKLEDSASRCLEERTQKICPTSRDLLKAELEKLEILKHQNMKKFILELRTEISELHEKCFIGAAERAIFTDMNSNVFDEECLEHHEVESVRLRGFYVKHIDFFSKIVRREEVWKKKMEMDEKESDPSRFNNRGGQLLRDQQEKAKVEHELKKLDADLAQKIQAWLLDNHTPFLVYGRSYADFVQEQKVAYEAQRDRQKDERKRAKDGVGAAAAAGKRKVEPSTHNGPPAKSIVQKNVGVAGLTQRSPKMQRTGPHLND